jgi:hypothetical protein
MLGSLIPVVELKKKLIQLLRKKYEVPNQLGIQDRRAVLKINNKIRLVKAICQRREMNMVEIECIITSWKLLSSNCEDKENNVVEPISINEAMGDLLGEY